MMRISTSTTNVEFSIVEYMKSMTRLYMRENLHSLNLLKLLVKRIFIFADHFDSVGIMLQVRSGLWIRTEQTNCWGR